MSVRALIRSARPHQWVKNSLIFGGLIFSHSMSHADAVRLSLVAFGVFCLASSGVYLLNDLRDLEADRRHPTKRLRPLAAGLLSPVTAAVAMACLLGGAVVAASLLRPAFEGVLIGYVLLNILYSLWLKQIVIVDVLIVALSFVLRAVAGAVVLGVAPSPWLVLCTLMLALLVAFGKRRNELGVLPIQELNNRPHLAGYSPQFLDLMMAISGGAAVVTYALYTMAETTVERVGSESLLLTIPWVLYGVFRYLYLVHGGRDASDPARLFLTDRPTLVNVGLWVIVVVLILYGPLRW